MFSGHAPKLVLRAYKQNFLWQSSHEAEGFDRALPPFRELHLGPLQLAVGLALLNVVALVEHLFALGHSEGHFHLAVLPVERERDQ